ncbi:MULTISPECIES: helix-turn-helix domain-containing protein [Thermoanaerobacterium]|uniref:Helix-turn-helix domain-containing protein n=2 Tax=Thermoanaerobacterium TaxID=28895 RepID=W9EA56_9THEO|nr:MULTISPECIES: helix-turn-helix transcriptional regulator [Thermoanaerobacterium]AFK87444.1 helix-turn-helix domain protein [Thermoanaerobacterium saccharolyticum JW/SL-YS485]ETO37815.1 helix-turn-helix domain-containing protein [Thermoanaerobacterium aotearoense SCUT27]
MNKYCTNIYKEDRKASGLTQEQAAELLHISTRSLIDYETNRTIPPDDVVCNMVEIYKAPWLGYKHLKQYTKVGQKYLPDLNLTILPESVLTLQSETDDLEIVKKDMIKIAADGVVDETEKDRWQRVTKEISEMAGAALAVIFAR